MKGYVPSIVSISARKYKYKGKKQACQTRPLTHIVTVQAT